MQHQPVPDLDKIEYLKFKALIMELHHDSRFILKSENEAFVDKIVRHVNENFICSINPDQTLYRARLNEIDYSTLVGIQHPRPCEEMKKPPVEKTKAGRINPEGISYLYCASDEDTAAAELRPFVGSSATIAKVEIINRISVVDLTSGCDDQNLKSFYAHLSSLFSVQWPEELKANYLICQYLAEHFKKSGLRGIKYNSRMSEEGKNYALFFEDDYRILTDTYNRTTMSVKYKFHQLGRT